MPYTLVRFGNCKKTCIATLSGPPSEIPQSIKNGGWGEGENAWRGVSSLEKGTPCRPISALRFDGTPRKKRHALASRRRLHMIELIARRLTSRLHVSVQARGEQDRG